MAGIQSDNFKEFMMTPFALLDAPGGGGSLFCALQRTVIFTAENWREQVAELEREVKTGLHAVLALDYEFGYCFELTAGPVREGALGYGWLFAERCELDAVALAAWLAEQTGDPPRPARIANFQASLNADDHAAQVAQIRAYIAAGDCYQVNCTFPFRGMLVGDPLALYARLRVAQPVAHGGLVMTEEATILSFSPELFVERVGGELRSRPMKGTAVRGGNEAEDATACVALAQSVKDRAENVMIVDLIRNDLARISRTGSVRVESLCSVETYSSVHQLTSSIVADANPEVGLASVLAALFPCGSITGAPKVRAMQIIRELESQSRGHYTGALGWFARGGDFRFNVAIRTLCIAPDGVVNYGVGGGIVWDSDASDEYAECQLKACFVGRADPGFRLIETLRLDTGDYPLLAYHLDRLERSAAAFAFACTRALVVEALQKFAVNRPMGIHRVRLTLGYQGDCDLTSAPLLPLPGSLRAEISPERLDSRSPWLRHKTTVRALYDRELARICTDVSATLFDVIFLNERDEVCEGARSNIFLRRAPGEPLLTPPLSCGLLPGTLRQQLLDSGVAREAVLYEQDLRGANELWFGNALRGLLPVLLTS